MNKHFLIALSVSFVFAGCKKDLEPQDSSISPSAAAGNTAAAPAQVQSVTPTPQPAAAPQQVTAPGMNPPHGQPGHRCDIAVGAPLNSPPGTGQKTAAPASAPITINQNGKVVGGDGSFKVTQNNAPAQKTAPGMNPPHGQPGHRCDIAVGAPLNSPAGTGQKNASVPSPVSINQNGTVSGGDGKVKITRTDNTKKEEVPTLLQAPEPASGQ